MLGVFLSVSLVMILGFLWYSPFVFGRTWIKLSGKTHKDIKKKVKKANMAYVYLLSALASLIMAYVVNRMINVLNIKSIYPAMQIGFWLWLGLIATTMLTSVLYDNKPWKLFLINAGYQLASVLIICITVILF